MRDVRTVAVHPGFDMRAMLAHRATADVALLQLEAPLAGKNPAQLGVPNIPIVAGGRFTIAGVGGVGIENRWITRLRRAEGEAFAAVLHDKVPCVAAWASPAIWLIILWLMIAKPI